MSAELYAAIIKLLDLPEAKTKDGKVRWSILDDREDEHLYLLHYNVDELASACADATLTTIQRVALLNLRGVIVDLKENRIVCKSFGYTSTVTLDAVTESPMELEDQLGEKFMFDPKTAVFQTCYEGTVLRVWKYKGKVYHSTHKRIDASRSRWGTSPFFTEIYKKLGGPSDEALFGKEPTSNFVHMFLLAHPDLQMATKADVGDGWLIHLRSLELNPVELTTDIEWKTNWKPTNMLVISMTDSDGNEVVPLPPPSDFATAAPATVYTPTTFSVKTETKAGQALRLANTILSVGYSGMKADELKKIDRRLHPGEALIVVCNEGRRMMKLASSSYHRRAAIGGNDPNRWHRFVELINHTVLDGKQAIQSTGAKFDGGDHTYSYDELFPYVGTPTAVELQKLGDELIAEGAMFVPPNKYCHYGAKYLHAKFPNSKTNPRDLRLRNIALCFACAVPIHLQVEVTGSAARNIPGFYARLVAARQDLIRMFGEQFDKLLKASTTNVVGERLCDDQRFAARGKQLGDEKRADQKAGNMGKLNPAGRAVGRICRTVSEFVGSQAGKARKGANGRRLSEVEIRMDSLRNLLMKENGTSLYAMIRAFTEERRPPTQPAQTTQPTSAIAELVTTLTASVSLLSERTAALESAAGVPKQPSIVSLPPPLLPIPPST